MNATTVHFLVIHLKIGPWKKSKPVPGGLTGNKMFPNIVIFHQGLHVSQVYDCCI
jgi:hypothetical protein